MEIRKTLCGICSTGCGVDAWVRNGRLVRVEGSREHPVNRGLLCGKGRTSLKWVYHPERIQTPLVRRGGKGDRGFVPVSWDEALDRVAERLLRIKEDAGPESVVFFVGYPKWLRPFLKRLAHGFGSPNYCSESSTCFFATVMANRLNFGTTVWSDLPNTRCIVNWSTNPYHGSPQRVKGWRKALAGGVKLIEVGPFMTPLARKADIHLRLRPGTDGALALSMAHVMIEEGLYDKEFVESWTLGFESYRAYAAGFAPPVAEGITGIPAETIAAAARLYATTGPAAVNSSPSVTVHHTNGVQNHRAITALIGLTGNFDRRGGNRVIPSTYYHAPTGLASREHAFEQVRPWEEMAPRIGADRFPVWASLIPEAQSTEVPFRIRDGSPYPVHAVLGFGLNHRMWPGSDFMREALERLDFFVDVDLFMTDTARMADIVLPACSAFERQEIKVYASRYAMWAEPAIAPLGESRSDMDIMIELSKRLNPSDTLMTRGMEACFDWMFEPSGIRMAEVRARPGGGFLEKDASTPYEKYREAGFPTPSGRMELHSTVLERFGMDPLPVFREPLQSPVASPELARDYPLVLTTGARLPMLMHSRMYRIDSARRTRPDPAVDIHPEDAAERGIATGDWVRLETPRGFIRVRANLTDMVPPGVVNTFHSDPKGDVNELIDPGYRDPISGYPGFKSLLCQVTPT